MIGAHAWRQPSNSLHCSQRHKRGTSVFSQPRSERWCTSLRSQPLPFWMDLQGVHVFIRPLLNTLIFLDLDRFAGSFEQLVALQPRCITSTSPGNYQFWATLPPPMQVKTASFVTKELQRLFQSDPHSTAPQQEGRLPGSMNVKPTRCAGQPSCIRATTISLRKCFYN